MSACSNEERLFIIQNKNSGERFTVAGLCIPAMRIEVMLELKKRGWQDDDCLAEAWHGPYEVQP